jgi:ABC-2 type transport system ATP-binding protein
VSPWFVTIRAVIATSGRESMRQSLAAYLGLAVVSAVLFGGNGLDAAHVIAACRAQPLLGAGLALAWVTFSLPPTATLLTHPKALFLRSLPLSRGALSAGLIACLGLVHLPWFVLWWRGQGAFVALGASCTCALVTLAVVAGRTRLRTFALAGAGVALWGSALPPPLVALVLSGAVVAAVRDVWWRVQPSRSGLRFRLGGPALVQLVLAYGRICLRSQRARVLRAAGYFVGAGTLSLLARLNCPPGETTRFPEVSLSLAVVFAVATLAPPILRAEHAARWVLAGSFAPRWLRRLSLFGTIAAFTVCFTLAFSSLAHASVAPAPTVGNDLTHWLSIALCGCVGSLAGLRVAVRHESSDARRVVVVVLGLAALSVLLVTRHAALFSGFLPCAAAGFTLLDALTGKGAGMFGAKKNVRVVTPHQPLLRVEAVHKRLGPHWVLRGASFDGDPGDQKAIVGANGAGKTTLLQILSGQLEPDRGEVYVAGRCLRDGAPEPRSQLGYVPDTSDALGDLSAQEFLDLVRALKGAPRTPEDALLEQRLAFSQLAPRAMRALSLGQRKRVCLLAALLGDPPLLVLDEPSNGLDTEAVAWLVELLKARAARGQVNVFSTNDAAFLLQTGAVTLRLQDGKLQPEL